MEIVTGSTGEAHVTPIDDAVRNSNTGYYGDRVVFDTFRAFEAVAITANEVRIYGGYGMNQGRIFKIDESDYDSCTIENGTQGVKRADLIVARYTMDSQTGFEDISLAVIKGENGNVYTDPSYTTGNMNEGATQDDFPLYRVKINGIIIEAVEPLFTALPDGGRLGLVEQKIDNHIADTEDPHRLAWTESQNLVPMSVSDKLNVQFGKIAKAITSLIAHIADKANPHEVSGSQLTGVVPISKGGTGASTAAGALQALGVPSDISDAMGKSVYTDTSVDAIKPAKGGTGRTSWTAGTVLVGNGTAAATERNIDSTTGGITNSSALITSGALNATKTQLQQSFQGGVDTIYNAVVARGGTPSASTPSAIATAVNNLPNVNTDTYTFAANDTGSTKDMGETNANRYVNAENVYTKGKADAEAVTWTETWPVIGLNGTERNTKLMLPRNATHVHFNSWPENMSMSSAYYYFNQDNADGSVAVHTRITTSSTRDYDINPAYKGDCWIKLGQTSGSEKDGEGEIVVTFVAKKLR